MKNSSTQNYPTSQLISNGNPWAWWWGGGGGCTGDIMQGGPVKFCSECSILSERLHRLILCCARALSCVIWGEWGWAAEACWGLSSALELDTVTLWKSWVPLSGQAFLQGDTFHNSTEQPFDHSLILVLFVVCFFFFNFHILYNICFWVPGFENF